MRPVPLNLNEDEDIQSITWYSSEKEVFDAIKILMDTGWYKGKQGLVFADDDMLMAKPVKIRGFGYRGIVIWKLSDHDYDHQY